MGERESWAVAVARDDGEVCRRWLLERGLLDRSLKVRMEGGRILLPILEPVDGAVRARFASHAPRPELPRHELVGSIAILGDPDPEAARLLLSSRPSITTVVAPEGHVEGPCRTRRFSVLAGEPTTVIPWVGCGQAGQPWASAGSCTLSDSRCAAGMPHPAWTILDGWGTLSSSESATSRRAGAFARARPDGLISINRGPASVR
jgi:hypothetical protein